MYETHDSLIWMRRRQRAWDDQVSFGTEEFLNYGVLILIVCWLYNRLIGLESDKNANNFIFFY